LTSKMLSTFALLGLAVPATATLHVTLTAGSHLVDFGVDQNFEVEYRVTNVGDSDERFLPWMTPLDGIWEDVFNIQDRNQNKVPYQGKTARRVPTQDHHYTTMKPGETLVAKLDLSDSYQLPQDGPYFITMNHLNQTQFEGAPVYEMFNQVSMQFSRVTAQLEKVREYRAALGRGIRNRVNDKVQTTYSTTCSVAPATVQGVTDGYNDATIDIQRATACLSPSSHTCGSTYTTWFGAGTTYLYNINLCWDKLAARYSSFHMECCPAGCGASCGPSMYGYVYPTDTSYHNVHLCGAYFSNALIEKSRTLTHELLHFNDVCATTDVGYGETNCKTYASTSPSNAYKNSDNHCYFGSYL